MKQIHLYAIGLLLLLSGACKINQNTTIAHSKYNFEKLYKKWDVYSITTAGKEISGGAMGDPQYEFTKEGQRIKSYKIPPHAESVDYFIRNDSIHYHGSKKLPSVLIKELTDSTLVLGNPKAEWKLYIKPKEKKSE